MKQQSPFIVFITSTLILLTISSCKKDMSTETSASGASRSANLRVGEGNTLLKYCLVQDGDYALYYDNAKRLCKKVYIKRPVFFTEYTYSPGKITALVWEDGVKYDEVVYELNSSGLCTASYHMLFDRGVPVKSRTKKYVYGGGSLYKMYYLDGHWMEKCYFNYDSSNNLISIEPWANTFGAYDVLFDYDYFGPLIEDKLQLNPEGSGLDPYLNIFGKFNQHLVRRIQYTKDWKDIDEYYSYTRNDAGYVTKRNAIKPENHSLISTDLYTYEWK